MSASSGLVQTTPSRLLSAPVNLSALRDDAWRELVALLESVRFCGARNL